MLIRIGDTTRNAMNIMGLKDYPFTPDDLTKAYRDKMLKWHPDVNKSEEATKISQEINRAKKILINLAISPKTFDIKDVEKAIEESENDIFKLWENCKECHGGRKTG